MQSFAGDWTACKSAAAIPFCRHDAAFLCLSCDTQIHTLSGTPHPRVSLSDQSPATITSNSAAAAEIDFKSEDIFFSDIDPFFEFDYPPIGDGVVPDQSNPQTESTENHFGLELFNYRSKLDSVTYPSHNHSHTVSSCSLDVGVVPDRNTSSDDSYPAAEKAVQLRGVDREMRVLRYREKKKNRKFEKTIRYASRKAYAEIRPRIKGRFVKRTEINSPNFDGIFAGAGFLSNDAQYGVVPCLLDLSGATNGHGNL